MKQRDIPARHHAPPPKLLHRRRLFLGFVLLIFGLSNGLVAQSWDRTYDHLVTSLSACADLCELPDEGFIAVGNMAFFTPGQDIFLQRMDRDGDTLWTRRLQWPAQEEAKSISQTADGGFVIAGKAVSTSPIASRGLLHRTNAQGDSIWLRQYELPGLPQHGFNHVSPTADGGFIATGWADSASTASRYYISVVRCNGLGDTLWTRKFRPTTVTKGPTLNYATNQFTEGVVVRELANGDFMVGAQHNNEWQAVLLQLDNSGNLQWSGSYGGAGRDWLFDIQQAADQKILLCGGRADSLSGKGYASVLLLDATGDSLQHYVLDPLPGINYQQWSSKLRGDSLAGFRVGGRVRGPLGNQPFTMSLNGQGDSIHFHLFSAQINGGDFFPNQLPLAGGGIANWEVAEFSGNPSLKVPRVLRLDTLQSLYTNRVRGNIFLDGNADCVADSLPFPLQLFIKALPGPHFTSVDAQGAYSLDLPAGNFTLSVSGPPAHWEVVCPGNPGSFALTLTDSMEVDSLDFGLRSTVACPRLRVDIGTPALRRCLPNTYYLTYINEGTETAQNAFVEVFLDRKLIVDSTSIPWELPQIGNRFRFLLGTVPVGAQGSILLHTTLSCDSTIVGQTHCVRAHIYPDSICGPISPQWDGSSLRVAADCINSDTVRFTVQNIGQNAMQAGGQIIVLEDNVLRATGSFQFNAGQDSVFDFAANGQTWHISAAQAPGHPGNSHPAMSLEGCGLDSLGNFSTGFVLTLPQDDGDFFRAIDCQASLGPLATNAKFSAPAGYGAAHWIEDDDALTYRIHFQNTGTDTAFQVVVRDTLAPFLDVNSLEPGSSSHPYQLSVLGPGVLKWTFYDIALPDSHANEAGSHGFVRYRLGQSPGNAPGTQIDNTAEIYFDFNAAARTNVAFNTVGENFVAVVIADPEPAAQPSRVEVYPNPVRGLAHFHLHNAAPRERWFSIYDLHGRLVHQEALGKRSEWQLDVRTLPRGLLVYKVYTTDRLEAGGKIIHQP